MDTRFPKGESGGEERREKGRKKLGVGFPAVGLQGGKVTFGYCWKYEDTGVSTKYRYMRGRVLKTAAEVSTRWR